MVNLFPVQQTALEVVQSLVPQLRRLPKLQYNLIHRNYKALLLKIRPVYCPKASIESDITQ